MMKSATTFSELFREVKSEEPLYGKKYDAKPFKSTLCSTDMAELIDKLEKMRVENNKLKNSCGRVQPVTIVKVREGNR